jgi:hypothetical protein
MNSEGLGIDNPCRIVFEFVNEQVLGEGYRHFWNPGVFSCAMIPRCRPNSRVYFFIVTSIVYGSSSQLCFSELAIWTVEDQLRITDVTILLECMCQK